MADLVPFSKMQGLGNDFVVFDAVSRPIPLTPALIRRLADRHFGIGCDQILVVEPSRESGVDFGYRIFNADGGEVEQCGNGARCFARFVRERGLTDKDEIRVRTRGGLMTLILKPGGQVRVNMGSVDLRPETVPFRAEMPQTVYTLPLDGHAVEVTVLALGNPHAVQVVPDVDTAPVLVDGPRIERHPWFPRGVNAGFMQIVDRGHVRVRVYERGAGETLACGSGACAAVAAGRLRQLLDERVVVDLPGGQLIVHWDGQGPVWMEGPAEHVFEGLVDLYGWRDQTTE